MGVVDRCFLVGTLGGDTSSLLLRLLIASASCSRLLKGVGSELDAVFRGGEPAAPEIDATGVSGCDCCSGAL